MSIQDLEPRAYSLEELELLTGFKNHLTKNRDRNVSPFSADAIVRYQTAVKSYDVPEIHCKVRDAIEKILEGIHGGNAPQIVILAGEAGIGKTHLINYFRLPEVAKKQDCVLICNPNSWKAEEFSNCLLDWLLTALTQEPSRSAPVAADSSESKRKRGLSANSLLSEKVEDIAFQALADLLNVPGALRELERKPPGTWLERRRKAVIRVYQRFKGLFLRSKYDRFREALEKRDTKIFAHINFRNFAKFVCEQFLAQPTNRLHRAGMHVLLRFLFPEDRDLVLNWFHGREVDKEFLNKAIGADQTLERRYEVMEAIQLVVSLFTREVAESLQPRSFAGRGLVFFFAFDQIEGRQELFDTEDDWLKFFANLSELYNSLPNIFVLFTMTLHLRNKLHGRMEQQFRDRIKQDDRFLLHDIDDSEVLALYQKRVESWLGDSEVANIWRTQERPFLPLTQQEVQDIAHRKRVLRQMIEGFDEEFRTRLEQLVLNVPLDYEVALKEITARNVGQTDYQCTKGHKHTVHELMNLFGARLGKQWGFAMDQMEIVATTGDNSVSALQLKLVHPSEPRQWCKALIVRLPFKNYHKRVEAALDLLFHRPKDDRYQLWLLRSNDFHIEPKQIGDRQHQVSRCVITPETELSLQAVITILQQRDQYKDAVWNAGETTLLGRVNDTYLGKLFARVQSAIQSSTPGADEDVGEDDLVVVGNPGMEEEED